MDELAKYLLQQFSTKVVTVNNSPLLQAVVEENQVSIQSNDRKYVIHIGDLTTEVRDSMSQNKIKLRDLWTGEALIVSFYEVEPFLLL